MKKLNLTKEVILNKKFPTALSGYHPQAVDQMLDQIIEDYVTFLDKDKVNHNKIVEKNVLLEAKDEEIHKLKLEIASLKSQVKEVSKATNYEILQEIKTLKNKLDD